MKTIEYILNTKNYNIYIYLLYLIYAAPFWPKTTKKYIYVDHKLCKIYLKHLKYNINKLFNLSKTINLLMIKKKIILKKLNV